MACHVSCLTLVLMVAIVTGTPPEVQLGRTRIVGALSQAYDTQKHYFAYYGIPYAKPPIGSRRFEAPVPYDNTESDRHIQQQSYRLPCAQSFYTSSEDCLYLNVFTPVIANPRNLAKQFRKQVIVFIHGGAYRLGNLASTHPSNLVTEYDVIVVSVAYRLGVFGYLSSGDDALPGNMGLLDQITALKWVKDNVVLFGGNPNNVTVYGQSDGGASMGLLSMSPLAKGLFDKVIMHGGSPLAPWAMDIEHEETFFRAAKNSNCTPVEKPERGMEIEYKRKIVDCLKEVPYRQLEHFALKGSGRSSDEALSQRFNTFFGPVVDGYVIPRDPFELLKDADYLKKVGALDRSYLLGLSNNEALVHAQYIHNFASSEAVLNPDTPGAQRIIRNNFQSVHSCPVSEEILHIVSFLYYYPRDKDGYSSLQSSADFLSDVDYVVPTLKFARALKAVSSDVKVYLNLFDYYPPLMDRNSELKGSAAGLINVFVFDGTSALSRVYDYARIPSQSFTTLRQISRSLVANMAKRGNPSFDDNLPWPAYDRRNEHYMAISLTPEVRRHMFARRVSMWEDFLPNVLGYNFTR